MREPSRIVTAESDPDVTGHVRWRVEASTAAGVQQQIDRLLRAPGCRNAAFDTPHPLPARPGWWCADGHTYDQLESTGELGCQRTKIY